MKQLGLTSVFFADPSVENWRRARTCGFENVEICYRDSFSMTEILEKGDKVYQNALKAGMTAATAHLPFLQPWDISSANVAERTQAIQWQKELLDHISAFGIPLAVLHPSFEPVAEEERPHRLALSAEAIGILGEHARSRGITLAVENLPRTCLGRCAEEMLILTDYGRNAKICMDVNHLLREKHSHYIETVGPHIVHTHLSDYDRADEKHWLPGNGVINWKELLSMLDSVGYQGNYLVEIREYSAVPGQTITPETVMERMKALIG